MCPLAVVVLLSVQHVQAVLLFSSSCKVSCGKWRRSGCSIEMVPKLPTVLLLTACLHGCSSMLIACFHFPKNACKRSTQIFVGFKQECGL